MEEALKVREKVHDEVVSRYVNVVGTGVGNKLVGGQNTGQPALILFVDRKAQGNLLEAQGAEQIVPQRIDNVPVDVIEVGDLRKHLGYSSRVRPIVPGYSVSHGRVTAGTIAGVFRDRDGQVVILSNNHVLANENRAKPGDLVFQPGTMDEPNGNRTFNGWEPAPDTTYVGTLKAFNPLSTATPNTHDSAIAVVHDRYLATRMIGANYPNSQCISGFGDAQVGQTLQKFGRTTGHTQGKVLAMHAELTIGYDCGPVTFRDLIVTDAMSQGGDSGSLTLDGNMKAVALLFAGSDKVSLHNPIKYVADHYGLEPWSEQPMEQIELWGRKWSRNCLGVRTIQPSIDIAAIEAQANWHAYLETPLSGQFQQLSMEIFSGSDRGASWGPGISVVYPRGIIKINIRYGGGFGGAWAGDQVYGIGSSTPDQWYHVCLTAGPSSLTAEVKPVAVADWTKVVEVPLLALGGAPTALRVGKTDAAGGGADHGEAGQVGRSLYRNLVIR